MSWSRTTWTKEADVALLAETAKSPRPSWNAIGRTLGVRGDAAKGRFLALTGGHAQARPATSAQPAEPKGLAAVEAIRDQVEGLERERAALAGAADGLTPDDRIAIDADHGVEFCGDALRVRSRDGLVSLHTSGSLSNVQANAGLAYRVCFNAVSAGLKSGIGNAGEGGGRTNHDIGELTARSPAALYRAYVMARLNQMERAVNAAKVDGREMLALRLIAGEGRTLTSIAPGGPPRRAYLAALQRALDAVEEARQAPLRIGKG